MAIPTTVPKKEVRPRVPQRTMHIRVLCIVFSGVIGSRLRDHVGVAGQVCGHTRNGLGWGFRHVFKFKVAPRLLRFQALRGILSCAVACFHPW